MSVNLPPGDNGSDARGCDHQHEISPISDEISQKCKQHVSHTPTQADDRPSEGTMLNVCPLNAWRLNLFAEYVDWLCKDMALMIVYDTLI